MKTGSQLVWRPDQWRQDAAEKASTQHREPSGPRLISLEIRPVGEKMLDWGTCPRKAGPQAPAWAAQENRKETRLWPIEWGSICCSSVRSPTPSHIQPFQIKWEVYFSKNCVARLYYCVVMIMYAYVYVYVLCVCIVGHGCDYTTQPTLVYLCIRVYKRILLMSLSLLHRLCPPFLVHLCFMRWERDASLCRSHLFR